MNRSHISHWAHKGHCQSVIVLIQRRQGRRTLSRYELTEFERRVIEPLLPNKPRGVPRVDDRRVLSGIFWILRSSSPWRDCPERYGPHTTCYNRFRRWTKAGIWGRKMNTITTTYGGYVRVIDGTSVRVHGSRCYFKNATQIAVLDEAGKVLLQKSML